MDTNNLVDRILHSNKHIRFVAICNMDGKIISSANNKNVTNLLSQEETEKTLQRAVSSWKSREELSDKTGEGEYVLAVYKKLKRITMPIDSKHLAYVTFNTDGGNQEVIEAIRFARPVDAAHGLSYEETTAP